MAIIMNEKSHLEKVTESTITQSSVTALAAILGGPVAALLPLLTTTLAHGRHKARVEAALLELDYNLSQLGNKIKTISDAQYKFINECVITISHSPDDDKVRFLLDAAVNSSAHDRLNLHEAGLISRVLRDITVEELSLLIECNGSKLVFHDTQLDGCINIERNSLDYEKSTGLIGLGLLSKEQAEGTWDDHGKYVYTNIASKLIELVSR